MSFSLSRAAVLAVALLLPCIAPAAPLSLEAALQLASRRSETARAAQAGLQGATEAARAAAQLPDPTLSLSLENLPAEGDSRFHTAREPMTMKRIGLRQEWLSAEKRAARQAAADASVGRERVQLQAAAADTRLQTALAYVDAFYAGETLKLAVLAEHHAHEAVEAARGRLASAAAGSEEVLALAVARGALEDGAAEVRQQQHAARIALARWTGVPSDALLAPGAVPAPAEEAYVARHPAVAAMRRDAELAARKAAVTASERAPNWTWEVAYGQRAGRADMVSVGVSVPLRLAPAERQDRDTAAALALAGKAEAELAEAVRAARTEYRTLQADAERLRQRIARYHSAIVAPAQQRTAAATAAYRSAQGSLAPLFEARHAEVDAGRRLLALERELARAQVQLAFRPIDAEEAQ